MKRKIPAFLFVLISVMLIFGAVYCFAADDDAQHSAIERVVLIREKENCRIEIGAKIVTSDLAIFAGDELYLFELLPWQSASKLAEQSPIDSAKAAAAMNFSLTFSTDSLRIYSKFLLARKLADGNYAVVTPARYIDNPELIASENYDYPTYASKQGLAVQLYTDAQLLGVSHTVINIPITDYIQTAKLTNSMQYTYCGATYYVNRDRLSRLDTRIRTLTEAGCHVYLNLILPPPTEELSDGLQCMYFTDDRSTGAGLYALNTTEKNSVLYFASFVNFLAERYTASDGAYGFAGSFIIGYEVNSNRSYNYSGARSLDSAMNYYTVAFRIADTALRTVYSNGRTYISLAGNWNTIAPDSTATIFDEKLDYSARDTLESFAAKMKYSGDIPWNAAINARPSDVLSTDFTTDTQATTDSDTAYISANNLGVFTDYMSGEDMLYNGAKRHITVSSFGISSRVFDEDGEPLRDRNNDELQAAMYALAYYRIAANPDIESCIYYRHVDNENELGRFGLWKADADNLLSPTEKKPIYELFANIDTDKGAEYAEPYLKMLGSDSWAELIDGYDGETPLEVGSRKTYTAAGKLESDTAVEEKDVIFSFSDGSLCGFTPDDNCEYIELRENALSSGYMLFAKGHYESGNEYMGVALDFDTPMNINGADELTVTLRPESTDGAEKVDVMIRCVSLRSGGAGSVYEGRYEGLKVGELSSVTFSLAAFAAEVPTIDSFKIWIRPSAGSAQTGDPRDYSFMLRDVALSGRGGFDLFGIIRYLFITLVALLVLLIIALIIVRAVNKKRSRKRRAHRHR